MARFKNKSRSMYNGPLSKLIKDAVATRMTALKAEGDAQAVWGEYAEVAREKLEDGRTKITERRTGEIAGGDDYDGSGGYMPDEEWKRFLESPQGKEYLERTSPKQVEEERVRFLEEVKKVDKRDITEVPRVSGSEMKPTTAVEPVRGENSFASQLGLDLDKYANKRGSANFAQRLADDVDVSNPFTQYLQGYIRGGETSGPSVIGDRFNEKTNKKLNKAYREFKEGSGRRAKNIDFNQWLLEEDSARDIMMKDKEFKQLLDENPDVRSRSLFDTMFSDSYSKDKYEEGFDPKSRNTIEQREFDRTFTEDVKRTGGETAAPKLKFANPKHPLNKRTMSFRRKR